MPLLFAALALAAFDAPITQVTVFTDQARVVRSGVVAVSGTATVEFPPLRDSADVSSIRVEARDAEVRRVDIERITPEKLQAGPARKVLAELAQVDLELDRVNQERSVLGAQRERLQRLAPTAPEGDALKGPPRLNPSGWAASATFSGEQLAKVQLRLRAGEAQLRTLTERREKLVEEARKLGNPATTSGWSVVAQLAGSGPATVTLTYVVRQARWTPSWDLQLLPDTNTVSLALAGVVSQETGEDWTQAALTLSTAVPSRAVKVPRLATWKIGVRDRFIPTPTPVFAPVEPPPPAAPRPALRTEEELLRAQLARLGGAPAVGALVRGERPDVAAFDELSVQGELLAPPAEAERPRPAKKMMPPPPPSPSRSRAPQAPPAAALPRPAVQEDVEALREEAEEAVPSPTSTFSLAPPPAWRPPSFGADSPVTLAQGYDLAFEALQKETIPSAKGARRVALWSAQWPVAVERKLFPAVAPDAFLVAELKNPSPQVLPGGPAQLYVGADPAGTARLQLVSPGEAFTLPLGIDRALRPVRNVKLVEATEGLFTKEEVGTYEVTIELANPYRSPVAVRVADQWPVSDQKEVETKLVTSKPTAIQDAKRGGLEWRVTIPPQQKQTFTFAYTVKRPRGWKLQQQEVTR